MICKSCGKSNAPMKKICARCGNFLEGWCLNNITGEYGYRRNDGLFILPKDMKIWELIIAQLKVIKTVVLNRRKL